ncbi:MAG: hypothetical protein FD123_4247, partial [Bacteroidetes bacterium]
MRRWFTVLPYILLLSFLRANGQQLDAGYPAPVPAVPGKWNAVAEDTAGNFAYMIKHGPFAAHTQWEVYKVDLTSNTGSSV